MFFEFMNFLSLGAVILFLSSIKPIPFKISSVAVKMELFSDISNVRCFSLFYFLFSFRVQFT